MGEVNKKNVDFSFETFGKTFNNIVDKHLPLRKLSIKEKKLS